MRRHVPDLPPTLPACPNPTGITPSSAGTLAAGTYLFYVTQTNPYGETLPCPTEQTVTVGSNGSFAFDISLYPGVTGVNVYMTLVGGASGTEIAVQNTVVSPAFPSVPVTSFPTVAGTPPTSNSAYMPDADGSFISAANAFSWLSDGLNKISYAVNGLLDYCGVPTTVGQPLYIIPGQWLNITDVWYGGYWIQGGQRQYFYRRTPIQSSVLASVSISMQTDRQMMELFYQPDRSAGVTTTTSILTATSNGVTVANVGAFLLAFGFAQLGAGSGAEIVAYSSLSGGIMGGLIRGMGNTIQQSWPISTVVTELPLFWCGKRIFNTIYTPGQSNLSIPVPSGWETIIDTYLLAQAKKKEQDLASWEKLEKSAMDMAQQWMLGNRGVASKVQVGGSFDLIEYNWTPAGGIIVP